MDGISVPVVKQDDERSYSAAAMSMLYRYCGKELSEPNITRRMVRLVGCRGFITDHARMAQEMGFQVICHFYNLEYFDPEYVGYHHARFTKRINILIDLVDNTISLLNFINRQEALSIKNERIDNKRKLKSILTALKIDIAFKMKMPCLKNITDFLGKKLPVMVVVNSAILFEKKIDLEASHCIVLTNYIDKTFSYNDPKDGRRKDISFDKLMFALSNNVLDSTGYLLVIQPEER